MITKKEILIKKKILFSKIRYYSDELIIFILLVASIMLADAIDMRVRGKQAVSGVIYFDWLNILISGILAIAFYGSMYTKWKYNDLKKPPLIKRISSAILQGIAWRTTTGWVRS